MRKIANFIVNKRYLVMGTVMVIMVLCAFLAGNVEINSDLTKYLADDSAMKIGMDLMEEEFAEQETTQTIRAMFRDLDREQETEVLSALENIPYVDSVSYDADSEDYNRENYTLFILNTSYDYGSEEELSIEQTLEEDFGDYDLVYQNDDTNMAPFPVWIILTALALLLIILLIMCNSWLEPFLFLGAIGVAVVINMGTNLIMGSISNVTSSIAAILQLSLSMDYSIILMNRYRQECEMTPNRQKAMKEALVHAFSSITSSSLTTIVGLLALVFMSFKIGLDLGVVLAKGVLISMLCIFTLLPGMILACDNLIRKTEKKVIHIPMDKVAAFSHRFRVVLSAAFVFLFVGVYLLQGRTKTVYTLATEDPIADVFPASNPLVIVYDTNDEKQMAAIAEELQMDPKIKQVVSYSNTVGKPYTAAELADAIGELDGGVELDASLLEILYYDYYAGKETEPMTAGEFLKFVSEDVLKNESFSEYLGDAGEENIDRMEKFADADTLTLPMNADKLADFFEMDADDVRKLFLYYYIQKGGVPTGTMTLPVFADFVVNEVASDSTYAALFDKDAMAKLEQLSTFTDAEKMTTPYGYEKIAGILGLDRDTAKLLFVYYYALSDSYTPEKMTLPAFVQFVRKDVAANPVFSSYFSKEVLAQMDLLAQYTDRAVAEKQMSVSELAELFGMDESMIRQAFLVYFGRDTAGKTMTLPAFTDFLVNTVLQDEAYAGYFDDTAKAQVKGLHQMLEAGLSGQELTTDQLAQLLGIEEDVIRQIFLLYFGNDTDGKTMTLPVFTDFLVNTVLNDETYADYFDDAAKVQLTGLHQVVMAAASGAELSAGELSAVTGMDPAVIESLFAYRSAATGQECVSMTLPGFLDFVLEEIVPNPDFEGQFDENTLTSLAGLQQIATAAASGQELTTDVLSQITGIDENLIRQIFILYFGNDTSGKTMTLPVFIDYLANTVLTDETYAGYFDEASKAQITGLSGMLEAGMSGKELTTDELAGVLGIDESVIQQIFMIYFGSNTDGKTVSPMQLIDFLLSEPLAAENLDNAARQQLQFAQTLMKSSISGTKYGYGEMAKLLGMDDAMTKMLYTYYASGGDISGWKLSVQRMVNFLTDNSKSLGSAIGGNSLDELRLARELINHSVAKSSYGAEALANLLGMDADSVEQLYLLYISEHGDTSGWKLSVHGFVNFLVSDVLTDPDFSDQFDGDDRELLITGKKLVDAVVSQKDYSAGEMEELLSQVSGELDGSTVELLYLYHASLAGADPTWTLTIDELVNYLSDQVLNDARFEKVIDGELRTDVSDMKEQVRDALAQLIGNNYSRLVLNSIYPEESEETTEFFDRLTAACEEKLSGNYYLVGNSAMSYEMQQSFQKELLFITLLTSLAIFAVVALTFRSVVIPAILVLIVQCGVYITVSVVGLQGYSIYYLALLIVECILMGATIDYGILFTNYYREKREIFGVKEALLEAYNGSIHTILTSGLILILVTGIIGYTVSDPTIGQICRTISTGALSATLLILFILPGLLSTLDRLIVRKK